MISMTPRRVLAVLALALLLLTGATVVRRPAAGPILHTIVLGMDPGSVAVNGVTGHAFVVDRDTERLRGAGPGTILDVYGAEAYEVEFSREDGSTIAWFAVKQDEVKPYIQSEGTASSMVSAGRSDP